MGRTIRPSIEINGSGPPSGRVGQSGLYYLFGPLLRGEKVRSNAPQGWKIPVEGIFGEGFDPGKMFIPYSGPKSGSAGITDG
jgi:hypothetical protein